MPFLTPLALLLAGIAGPIILLYMLRLRRREVPISSTMLWQKVMQDREANTPWQKLRRNLLLLLQLLILAMLVLALARPFIPVPSVAAGSVALLIDASASMNATDGSPTRFETALEEARILVRDLGANEVMTIIAVGPSPQVLAPPTADKAALRDALARAEPTAAPADWEAALALAGASIAGRDDAAIVIISDGGLPADLPALPADVRYLRVGEEGDNVGISAMATRPLGTSPQLFVSVTNYGSEDTDVILSLEADGELIDAERVTVPGGGSIDETITDLPADVQVLRAELTRPVEGGEADFLPLDDVAYAVYAPPTGGDILLVTEGNLFLEQLLAAFPGVEAFRSTPGDLPEREFDLVVFDAAVPDELPETNILVLGPTQSTNLSTVTGAFEETRFLRQAEDPILSFVNFGEVAIREAAQVEAAGWARPLIEAEGGPLLLAGDIGGRRVAILTFDLLASDLPLRVDFPILIANLLEWYAPAQVFAAPDALQPGEPVTIRPGPTTTEYRVVRPDGSIRRSELTDEEVSLSFAATGQIGVYTIELYEGSELRSTGSFAVNLFEAGESRIAPADAVLIGQGEVQDAASGENELGQRELWPILAAIALIVLVIEWIVYHRGTRLPRRQQEESGAFAFLRRS
ncbi:MAG: VWA domain-containing protein [Anaerolineae bacterium]